MSLSDFACLGDTIECDVQHPQPGRLRVHLITPEACAQANDRLTDTRSGWRLVARENPLVDRAKCAAQIAYALRICCGPVKALAKTNGREPHAVSVA